MGPYNQGQPWYLDPWQQVTQPQTGNQVPMAGSRGNAPMQPGFKICPVASYDEAKAIPTDFMGNVMLMPDLTHGYIYTKIFNPNTGGSVFTAFKAVQYPEMPAPVPPPAPMPTPAPVPNPPPMVDTAPAYDAKAAINQLKSELDHIKKELGIKEEENQ